MGLNHNNNLMAMKGSVESQELCADPASTATVSPVRRPPRGFWASRMWSACPVTVAVGSSYARPHLPAPRLQRDGPDVRCSQHLGSGLDCRPFPGPKAGPAKGVRRVGFYGQCKIGLAVTRADIGQFTADQVHDQKYLRAPPPISNGSSSRNPQVLRPLGSNPVAATALCSLPLGLGSTSSIRPTLTAMARSSVAGRVATRARRVGAGRVSVGYLVPATAARISAVTARG